MNICVFGTCRLLGIIGNNNLNELINFTHSTKEIIQLIKFITNKIIINEPYNRVCFRTAICKNNNIYYNDYYKHLFEGSKLFVIEICSRKKYIHNNHYLHHLCVDNRNPDYKFYLNTPENILNEYKLEYQTDEEIEDDILEIQRMIYPRKMIIVSHFNAKLKGEYIKDRKYLINLLENICKKHNIHFISPSSVFAELNYSEDKVYYEDLGHYKGDTGMIISRYINNYIYNLKER